MRVKKITLILTGFFLIALLANLQARYFDAESYLNTLTKIDKNKDYDHDGSTEDIQDQIEIYKEIMPLVFLSKFYLKIVIEPIALFQLAFRLLEFGQEAFFHQQIFRPPIDR